MIFNNFFLIAAYVTVEGIEKKDKTVFQKFSLMFQSIALKTNCKQRD